MRALLSPFDKTALIPFAQGLVGLGFDLFATDGEANLKMEQLNQQITKLSASVEQSLQQPGKGSTARTPQMYGRRLASLTCAFLLRVETLELLRLIVMRSRLHPNLQLTRFADSCQRVLHPKVDL